MSRWQKTPLALFYICSRRLSHIVYSNQKGFILSAGTNCKQFGTQIRLCLMGPDLDPNCLILMVFLKEFIEKFLLKISGRQNKKATCGPISSPTKCQTWSWSKLSCLKHCWYSWKNSLKKLILKKPADDKKVCQITQHTKCLININIIWHSDSIRGRILWKKKISRRQ